MELTATTLDIICVRYGASGNLEDNWCNKETMVLVDASTNEDLQEASYYIEALCVEGVEIKHSTPERLFADNICEGGKNGCLCDA